MASELERVKQALWEIADFKPEGEWTADQTLEMTRLRMDGLKILAGILVKKEGPEDEPPVGFTEDREPPRGKKTRVVE